MVCIFQGQSSKQFEKSYFIPGREIPNWLEKVNICGTEDGPVYKKYKVKIQLPGSECDEWSGIVLCVVFFPTESMQDDYGSGEDICTVIRTLSCPIMVGGLQVYDNGVKVVQGTRVGYNSEYGKVESHHLWLQSLSKINFCLPKNPGCYIDKKGFHQVELEIETGGLEVEKIGFRVV